MPVLPSYRSQSIDLRCKWIDWFLYEGNTGTYGLNNSKMMFNASISSCWKCFSLVDYRCFRNWIETYLLDKIMLDGKSKIRVTWYLQTSNFVLIITKKKIKFLLSLYSSIFEFFYCEKKQNFPSDILSTLYFTIHELIFLDCKSKSLS